MPNFDPEKVKRVAIIGAGPSGLTAAKYLLAEKKFSDIVIFEQRGSVGGTWNYAPLLSDQDHSPPNGTNGKQNPKEVVTTDLQDLSTPMYQGLEANLPHMLMQYSDTPFPKGAQLFASRETTMQYLEDYASDLKSMLRLNHEVLDVRLATDNRSEGQWTVTTKSNGKTSTTHFDGVIVANGHCERPLMPTIEGLDEWAGQYPDSLTHSVSYRSPARFKDKRVLLVGGGPSGADIGHQIAQVCKHPLIAAQPKKSPYHLSEPNEIEVDHPTLVHLDSATRTATFEDGSIERDVDIILLCTGYEYEFPFLSSLYPKAAKGGPDAIQAIHPFQYIFDVEHPTLTFIETLEGIVPFPMAEAQASVIARVWAGRLPLPSTQDMQSWVQSIIDKRGPGRAFHHVSPPLDLAYMREMYHWSQQAENESKIGQKPRDWTDYYCWLRMEAAEIKKAFVKRGEGRHQVLTYDELGFEYDGRKFDI